MRTRNIEGVSLTAWKAILALNLARTAHSIRIAAMPLIVVWRSWPRDPGTIMTASAVCGPASFNLPWYVLRRAGLRAFFPHETPTPPPALVSVAP